MLTLYNHAKIIMAVEFHQSSIFQETIHNEKRLCRGNAVKPSTFSKQSLYVPQFIVSVSLAFINIGVLMTITTEIVPVEV